MTQMDILKNEDVDNEIILVDKPKGITSFDVIRILRKKIGVRKMGHAGTLDPLATGLMLVASGAGTKKLKDLIGLPKTYEVEMLIGRRTTTGDMEGGVVEGAEVSPLAQESVESVLASLVGTITLLVPIYSAIKKDGNPFYKYARKGQEVDVPQKDMHIYTAELLGMTCHGGACVLSVRMSVGSGTYVRSVTEEVGRRLGYPATVKELRRTKVGVFDVRDAVGV